MGNVTPILVVTGTRAEAAVLERRGIKVITGGGNAAALEGALREGIAAGAAGIISFGMGGALDPALLLGDMVIGSEGDPAWMAALERALPDAHVGRVYADGRLCASADAKAALFAGRAIAVDMESHIAARVAAEAGLPFAILRCVSDRAADDLPPAVAVAMGEGGRLALGAVLGSILRQPGQIGALIGMARRFARAHRQLRRTAHRLTGRLCFDLRGG